MQLSSSPPAAKLLERKEIILRSNSPIPAPKLTQGASRAGFWRAAALYDCQALGEIQK